MKKRNVGIVLTIVPFTLLLIIFFGLSMSWAFVNFCSQPNVPSMVSELFSCATFSDNESAQFPGIREAIKGMMGWVNGLIGIVLLVMASTGVYLIKTSTLHADNLHVKKIIHSSWEFFKKHAQLWILIGVLRVLLEGLLFIPSVLTDSEALTNVYSFFSGIIGTYLNMGMIAVALLIVAGEKAKFDSLFLGLKMFIRFFIATFLYGFIVGLGTVLLFVPGIYFAIKYQFFGYFIVDKKVGILESFRLSADITRGKKMDLLLLGFVLQMLIIASMIPLGLGLFISIPMQLLANAMAYKQLSA